MPISRAASRFDDTARTARPAQVRVSHHHRPPISTRLTAKNSTSLRMLYSGPNTIASCSHADLVDRMSAFHSSSATLVSMTAMP